MSSRKRSSATCARARHDALSSHGRFAHPSYPDVIECNLNPWLLTNRRVRQGVSIATQSDVSDLEPDQLR